MSNSPLCLKHVIVAVLVALASLSTFTIDVNAADELVGTVTSYENGEIICQINDYSAKVRVKERLEVVDYNGKNVATLSVKSIGPKEIICKKERGSGDIRPGFNVRKRRPLNWALTFEGISFPVDVVANEEYATLTSTEPAKSVAKGRSFVFGAIFRFKKDMMIPGIGPVHNMPPIQVQLTTAYIDFGAFSAWEIANLGPALRLEFVPERFRLELGGGGGLVAPIDNIDWARSPGSYADSLSDNRGAAAYSSFFLSYRGWIGLHYQVTRELGLFVRGTYYKFSNGGTLYDTRAPSGAEGDARRPYYVSESWLEKRITTDGGIGIQTGIQYWFKLK